jgi:hypothetical protein
MNTTDLTGYIEANTIRVEASSRGGGIEIDASGYTGIDGAKMMAYQNYLGGGMLGSVQSDCNTSAGSTDQQHKLVELAEALKRYYHAITNETADEWSESSYEANQSRPESGY